MARRVLVLIPARNEAESIQGVINDLRRYAPDFDRLLINDGSTDGTASIALGMGERVASLACNLGYGRALQTGLRYALSRQYDFVVFFDGDGQHRAEDAVRLVNALDELSAHMVIGSRFREGGHFVAPLGRRIGQMILSRITQILFGQRIYDTTSGLKAIRTPLAETLVKATFLDFHIETLVRLSLMRFSIAEIPVSMNQRQHGHSMHSFWSAIEYPLKMSVLTVVAAVDAVLDRRRSE
jgi:glycosyltransferase involved in cell wall biosynthesis